MVDIREAKPRELGGRIYIYLCDQQLCFLAPCAAGDGPWLPDVGTVQASERASAWYAAWGSTKSRPVGFSYGQSLVLISKLWESGSANWGVTYKLKYQGWCSLCARQAVLPTTVLPIISLYPCNPIAWGSGAFISKARTQTLCECTDLSKITPPVHPGATVPT